MRVKGKLFLTTAFAALLGVGVFAGVASQKEASKVAVVEASGTIDTSGKTLISLKNTGWTEANAKTAVYFWNSTTHGWSSKYVAQFPVYDSTNKIYIVDVPSGTWTNYKCVRVNPTGSPSTPSDTCWNYNWGETSNFTYGSNNTLEPVINGGYNYGSAWKFEAGLPVYLDLNGQGWTSDNAVVCAYFWGNTAGGSATKLLMNNVHGWDNGNVNLYEITVPGSGYWSNMLFYRAGSVDGSWYNQTSDLSGNESNNVYKLTGYTSGSWNWDFADASRAEAYGTYFLSHITCSGGGSITSASSHWTDVSNEYSAMSLTIQGLVYTSSAAESGTDLVKAMYRYDYIVFFKHYSGYNDFINRATSSGKSFSIPINPLTISNNTAATIAIIAVSATILAAVVGYFLFRKKKEN